MKRAIAACLLVAAAGCASSSTRERVSDFRDGVGPDLRIFTDDQCPGIAETRAIGLVGEVVKGVASLAMKSFGRYLQEVGSPEIETAYGTRAELFYDLEKDEPELNPKLRCIYIVRDGFSTRGFDQRAPEEVRAAWQRHGLTGTPSFYALARLDPARDNSDYFKATFLEFSVQRFARAGAEAGRDYVVFLEFAVPSSGRQYKISERGEISYDPTGPFARDGITVRGAQRGVYLREADLKGMETGWMSGPPTRDAANRRPVNLYVNLVELKRGNPFIADLGAFLQSSPVTDAAGQEAMQLVNRDERERADVAAGVTAEKAQRALVNTLETRILELRAALASNSTTPSSLLTRTQQTEDAAAELEFQRRQKGWVPEGSWPTQMLADAKTLTDQARARLNGP